MVALEWWLQIDGNRVAMHKDGTPHWYSRSSLVLRTHQCFFWFAYIPQIDGNLVAKYKDGTPYWDTHTSVNGGCSPYKLELRDDCVAVIRDCIGNKIWSVGDAIDFGYGYNRPIYQPEPQPGPGTCSPIPACQGNQCPPPPACKDLGNKGLCLSVDACCWWVLRLSANVMGCCILRETWNETRGGKSLCW
jgi:hypothetical protein